MKFINNRGFKDLWNRKQYKEALREPLEEQSSNANLFSSFLFGDKEQLKQTATVGALSVGEFLYDYIRLDPRVVEGIDFARTDDLSSLFTFSQFSKTIDTSLNTGDIAQMQGYVAERMIASELQAKGHDVEFPDTSNNPGWDLLVDGTPFQVKNLGSPAGVHEHLEKYPDIPVYVNEELAGQFENNPMVYATQVSHTDVVQSTKQTLDIGADLTDFEIPWISLMVSSGLNVKKLIYDEIKLRDAVFHVLSDTSSRAVLGAAGQYVGSAVGLVLFGPAGGLIGSGVGAFLGVGQGGRVSSKIKGLLARKDEDVMIQNVSGFVDQVNKEIDHKLKIKNDKITKLHHKMNRSGPGIILMEDIEAHHAQESQYIGNKKQQLATIAESVRRRDLPVAEGIPLVMEKTVQSGVHPVLYQAELKKLLELLQAFSKKMR